MNDDLKKLAKQLINENYTLIDDLNRFDSIASYAEQINALDGDVVETGVWKGGMSIFLANVFPEKTIWVCDSFEGCQNPGDAKFQYSQERHIYGMYGVSLEDVKKSFKNFGLDQPRIKYLKGFFRDSLEDKTCPIQKISLLRIDCDSYSATLEVLTSLYDKVVSGGLIVFDDSCLYEARDAIKKFIEMKNLSLPLYSPDLKTIYEKVPDTCACGCFFIKP